MFFRCLYVKQLSSIKSNAFPDVFYVKQCKHCAQDKFTQYLSVLFGHGDVNSLPFITISLERVRHVYMS